MGNFDFLLKDKDYQSFAQACIDAEKAFALSTVMTAFSSRHALELAVKWMYEFDRDLHVPYHDNLSTLVHTRDFQEIVDHSLVKQLEIMIKLGNVAIHTNKTITKGEATLCLNTLFQFVNFIDYCYGEDYKERTFDEELLPIGFALKTRESSQVIQDFEESLPEVKPLQVLRDQHSPEVRYDYAEKRLNAADRQDEPLVLETLSEAETRRLFIDVDLRLAGWTINKDCRTEVPVKGMKNNSGDGFVDYVLYGKNELPLAVVEAKKASVSPKVGSQQAKEYADLLEAQTGQRPLIFYTNGFETWFVDDFSERPVSGFYNQDELQLLIDRRLQRQSLTDVASLINDDISNRYYQKEAIVKACESFESNARRALLVMATGSGKTRTAISLVDVLSKKNWVKNVLFLADRTSLVKQAYRSFNKLLPHLTLCNLLENPDAAMTSRMVFSTYPTMMHNIDGIEGDKKRRLFTVGHFDLIIIDESHRSIYQKYKTIFDYFDARVVGLTATPRDDLDKNTYQFFTLEDGVPTYAYDLRQAVRDKYLVSYKSIETQLKLPTDGLHYDDLSPEEKARFDSMIEDGAIPKDIDGDAFNKFIFNKSTVSIVLDELMEKGIRTASGDDIGKTIIFAKNHAHADYIAQVFHERYPEKGKDYVKVIDYSIKHYQQLIDDFSVKEGLPQIAISVDMLDTGIDVPEVVNLVFFKKIRSKIKFWQMIGRGTRLCPNLFGPNLDKDGFLIFDYGDNFTYFREDEQKGEGHQVPSLTQRLYNIRIDLIRELQDLQYQDDFHIAYRQELIDEVLPKIQALDPENFQVRLVLKSVSQYSKEEAWQPLQLIASENIKRDITPLILPDNDDELAKRFDLWVYRIEQALLLNTNATPYIKQIMVTAQQLQKLGTIPQVREQGELLTAIQKDAFWQSIDLSKLENIRKTLRDLVCYLENTSSVKGIYYTDFDDSIVSTVEDNAPLLDVNDLRNYKEKVEHYLKEHLTETAVAKLYHNEELNAADVKMLETILWTKLGTKQDYDHYFAQKSITRLVREIVGLDRVAANEAFAAYLSNESLNSKQISFVKLIVDYIIKNGYLEKTQLQKEPFKSYGSLITLFEYEKPVLQEIIQTIDWINQRADEMVS